MFQVTITPVEEQAIETGGHVITGEETTFTVPDVFISWLEKALGIEKSEEDVAYRILRHGLVIDYEEIGS